METKIVAANTVRGRVSKIPVKYKQTKIIVREERTPEIGVFAPASLLTTVRDKLPETANPIFIPAAILAKPRAISS